MTCTSKCLGRKSTRGRGIRGNFPFRKPSLPFGTVIAISNNSLLSLSWYSSGIQLILILTLALILAKINFKRRNEIEKRKQKQNKKNELPCFEPMAASILALYTTRYFFVRTSKFWLSLGLFLNFPIHLLNILAKSQPGCSYKVCSYKEKSVYHYANNLIQCHSHSFYCIYITNRV